MVKTMLSYLFPQNLRKAASALNGVLEVNLVNGRKVLDTRSSNYSYGSLQRILHRGLVEVGFSSAVRSVLVLGLGGGSVVQTIRADFASNAFIELVEIDPVIVALAKDEFNVEQLGNVHIVLADALDYMRASAKQFDVVIVDVFIIDVVPEAFTSADFIKRLAAQLNPGGKLIYNTMRATMPRATFARLFHALAQEGLAVRVVEQVELTNDLLLGAAA